MSAKILICEDEPDIVEILESFLSGEGYEIRTASTGPEGLERFGEEKPDLVLLDVMLPEKDGWQVLGEIRQRSECPIILLTALTRLDDKVKGLTLGADDYVPKPFELDEVRARIDAVLRRTRPCLERVGISVDDARKEVRVDGRLVFLSPKEYQLLRLLSSEPGRVFSNEEILSVLWSDCPYASSQDVQKYVYLLRRKLEEDPADPKIVLTVRGFGYRLAA